MPIARLENVRLHYRIDGAAEAPWLVMCNSLGTTLQMWDSQIPFFSRHFRVLRYDSRGHGGSSVPAGLYTAADLGEDVADLMDYLDIRQAAFCGLSIGGITGQWLALNQPDRFTRMVLCSTGAKIGDKTTWQDRIDEVRGSGMAAVSANAAERWFTPAFAATGTSTVNQVLRQIETTSPEGYIGCIGALIDADFRDSVAAIRMPLLTVAGSEDPVTPPSALSFIAKRVSGARQAIVPGAHLCNIESPGIFNEAVLGFLKE